MKIAYLVNQYPQPSHSFIRREIAALEAQGVTVQRFTLRAAPRQLVDPADRAEQTKTRVVLSAGPIGLAWALVITALTRPGAFLAALTLALRCGSRGGRGRVRHLIYLAEACVLRSWLRRGGAAHLHAHFGTNSTTVAMLCRALGGPPYSFTVHGPEEFDSPMAIALDEKLRRCAFAVGISDFGRGQLCRWCPPDQWQKIHVVRCGVDQSFLDGAPPVPVPAVPRLVCVARLSAQKGQAFLVRAAAKLAEDGVECELVLAGDGELRTDIERQISNLGLGHRIRITGWLSNAEVRREILNARALVLSSLAEGLPVVIMEALALGRPVIATAVGGVVELVEDGVSGWIVPAGNVDALAEAMATVLRTDPAMLGGMGRAGALHVAVRHHAATEAGRLAELFQATIDGVPHRPSDNPLAPSQSPRQPAPAAIPARPS